MQHGYLRIFENDNVIISMHIILVFSLCYSSLSLCVLPDPEGGSSPEGVHLGFERT